MELIKEHNFYKIFFNTTANMYEFEWNEKTVDMEEQDFKNILFEFTDRLLKSETTKFLADARNKKFTMNNDLQEWHDEVIIPKYINAGIQYIAFVVEEYSMVDISIELTFDEANGKKIDAKFFNDVENARNWIDDIRAKRAS